ncbi:MAG: CRISPR system precrRNA processing endoribonuclease RAMP protein Cas6 [Nitrospirota bacterium]
MRTLISEKKKKPHIDRRTANCYSFIQPDFEMRWMDMQINYNSFIFHLEPKEIIVLPSYKGSTLRGGFGNAFKRVVCALKKTDCAECILREKCVYSYVFETPPPSDTKIMKKYTNAPHPFIIEPPPERKRGYKSGDEIIFGLTLIGRAVDYLPYFIYTFDELGKIGLGKGKGRYELKEVRSNEGDRIYSAETKTLKPFEKSTLTFDSSILHVGPEDLNFESGILNLGFVTPTRLVFDGRLTLDLEFHMLIRQLLRRISLLGYFHCGLDPSEIDFRGIIEKAKEVKTVKKDLKWHDWERYSVRQDARMKMGGFVGEITFEGDISPFMPLIKAGEILHVGKGTSFGLGRFRVLNLES